MEIITINDLPESVRGSDMVTTFVDGANARATRVAPCLADNPTPQQMAEARLILVGAIKRWSEAGSGAVQQQSAGPFSMGVDTRQRGGFNLWPSEIAGLQDVCGSEGRREAFAVDLAPAAVDACHSPICSLNFGATYCSCAANIAGFPLYEQMD